MAARKKPVSKTVEDLETTTSPKPAILRQFTEGDEAHPGFTFFRIYYEGKEGREGLWPIIAKKLRPGDDPIFGDAAKGEVLVPGNAPGDYANIGFLVRRFDEALPSFEKNVGVHVKIVLDPDEAWHGAYERVRAYVRSHFVALGHAAILVAHIPGSACLAGNGSHIHCIVLSRKLTINGFAEVDYVLCSDRGHASAWKAWQEHLAAEGSTS